MSQKISILWTGKSGARARNFPERPFPATRSAEDTAEYIEAVAACRPHVPPPTSGRRRRNPFLSEITLYRAEEPRTGPATTRGTHVDITRGDFKSGANIHVLVEAKFCLHSHYFSKYNSLKSTERFCEPFTLRVKYRTNRRMI